MDGLESISPDFLDGISVVGLAVLIIIAYVRGWVVTPREHRLVVHDRDEWRTESRIKDTQLALKDAQLGEKDVQLGHMKTVGDTVQQLARGLQYAQQEHAQQQESGG